MYNNIPGNTQLNISYTGSKASATDIDTQVRQSPTTALSKLPSPCPYATTLRYPNFNTTSWIPTSDCVPYYLSGSTIELMVFWDMNVPAYSPQFPYKGDIKDFQLIPRKNLQECIDSCAFWNTELPVGNNDLSVLCFAVTVDVQGYYWLKHTTNPAWSPSAVRSLTKGPGGNGSAFLEVL